mgnify:CR=1 FL=1
MKVEEVKEKALETVYDAYYDMYMSKAQKESEVVENLKSLQATTYVKAFTQSEIVTEEDVEEQREAAFEDAKTDATLNGVKEKARKIMANLNAVTKAEIYLDEHKDDINVVDYYETKIHLTAMAMRMDGIIKGFERVYECEILTFDEVANLLNERKLESLKELVDDVRKC